jgi:anti-sigma factor RsiW
MTCAPELVTGYVDGGLEPAQMAEIEAHLAACESCRSQAAAEREVRGRLLGLLHPPLPAGLDDRVRSRLYAAGRISLFRLLVPVAVAAVLAFVWLRQKPQAVAWEMVRDHDHCFGRKVLPAQVWAEDAESVLRWFEGQGTRMPVVPNGAAGYGLIGARYCSFPDLTRSAHVYYRKGDRKGVSIFVLPRSVGSGEPSLYAVRQHVVYVTRIGGMTVGVVGEGKEDVEAFSRTFETTVARIAD